MQAEHAEKFQLDGCTDFNNLRNRKDQLLYLVGILNNKNYTWWQQVDDDVITFEDNLENWDQEDIKVLHGLRQINQLNTALDEILSTYSENLNKAMRIEHVDPPKIELRIQQMIKDLKNDQSPLSQAIAQRATAPKADNFSDQEADNFIVGQGDTLGEDAGLFSSAAAPPVGDINNNNATNSAGKKFAKTGVDGFDDLKDRAAQLGYLAVIVNNPDYTWVGADKKTVEFESELSNWASQHIYAINSLRTNQQLETALDEVRGEGLLNHEGSTNPNFSRAEKVRRALLAANSPLSKAITQAAAPHPVGDDGDIRYRPLLQIDISKPVSFGIFNSLEEAEQDLVLGRILNRYAPSDAQLASPAQWDRDDIDVIFGLRNKLGTGQQALVKRLRSKGVMEYLPRNRHARGDKALTIGEISGLIDLLSNSESPYYKGLEDRYNALMAAPNEDDDQDVLGQDLANVGGNNIPAPQGSVANDNNSGKFGTRSAVAPRGGSGSSAILADDNEPGLVPVEDRASGDLLTSTTWTAPELETLARILNRYAGTSPFPNRTTGKAATLWDDEETKFILRLKAAGRLEAMLKSEGLRRLLRDNYDQVSSEIKSLQYDLLDPESDIFVYLESKAVEFEEANYLAAPAGSAAHGSGRGTGTQQDPQKLRQLAEILTRYAGTNNSVNATGFIPWQDNDAKFIRELKAAGRLNEDLEVLKRQGGYDKQPLEVKMLVQSLLNENSPLSMYLFGGEVDDEDGDNDNRDLEADCSFTPALKTSARFLFWDHTGKTAIGFGTLAAAAGYTGALLQFAAPWVAEHAAFLSTAGSAMSKLVPAAIATFGSLHGITGTALAFYSLGAVLAIAAAVFLIAFIYKQYTAPKAEQAGNLDIATAALDFNSI